MTHFGKLTYPIQGRGRLICFVDILSRAGNEFTRTGDQVLAGIFDPSFEDADKDTCVRVSAYERDWHVDWIEC